MAQHHVLQLPSQPDPPAPPQISPDPRSGAHSCILCLQTHPSPAQPFPLQPCPCPQLPGHWPGQFPGFPGYKGSGLETARGASHSASSQVKSCPAGQLLFSPHGLLCSAGGGGAKVLRSKTSRSWALGLACPGYPELLFLQTCSHSAMATRLPGNLGGNSAKVP